MHTFIVLLLAAAAACAVPRPFGPTAAPSRSQLPHRMARQARPYRSDYILPRMLMPNPYGYANSLRAVAPTERDWLNKEIERINRMEDDEDLAPLEDEFTRWISRGTSYISRPYVPEQEQEPAYVPDTVTPMTEEIRPLPPPREINPLDSIPASNVAFRHHKPSTPTPSAVAMTKEERKKTFALTPLDKEYYEPEDKIVTQKSDGPHEGGETETHHVAVNVIPFQPPRQIRQNPNLGRTKNLVAENLNILRAGQPNKDYRIPVSLLPTNLRWLRIIPTDAPETRTPENPAGTKNPHDSQVLESAAGPEDSIYGVALIAAVGTAVGMAIIGFAVGWYTLSKKAKAAADVDYPAYGVTGPNIDTSGDRKLAHSAHMYHYQHQKQQIIAMERNGCDLRNGSISDPESEEENEEGDYTVYECPGFATTGEMEVKNPLFSEDPTPATPGKCEIVKPQPKD